MPNPVLSKAPISDAILEVRHKAANKSFDSSYFESLAKLFKDKLPTSNPTYERNIEVKQKDDGSTDLALSDVILSDYRYNSTDNTMRLMISHNVFNLNFAGNYKGWDEIIEEFKIIWDMYYQSIDEKDKYEIIGISLRYINRIEISRTSQLA